MSEYPFVPSTSNSQNDSAAQTSTISPPRTPSRLRTARDALRMSSAAYLLSPTPVTSSSEPPSFNPVPISPFKRRFDALLAQPPATEMEEHLQKLLKALQDRYQTLKTHLADVQAGAVLQAVYMERVQSRLEGQEEREAQPKKRKLFGDGLPKLLTDDKFFGAVEDIEATQRQEAAAKKARKAEREEYAKQKEAWKKVEDVRKERNKQVRATFKQEMAGWGAEKKSAKQEGRAPRWGKPKRATLESPVPCPRMLKTKDGEEDVQDIEENEDDDDDEQD
ncbi:hypothetical protein BD310DRAFT_821665 [Dichomitus squalens]|uniref:Uncharacterized protein n=1 Tax=Dichomitus squalens TaxID=114155 RepID=A0A4Q9PSU6_9APHY|nr:hypothetical protein BD310DRAFT_821665 [Dichomitus squalens]